MFVHAPSHTREVFDPRAFPKIVDWVAREARARGVEALAACGHSGLLVAGAAAYVLHVPVFAVRKIGDRAKGDSFMVNGVIPAQPFGYAFVDDFLCSGETFANVVRQIGIEIGDHARCRWALLYRQGTDENWALWTKKRFGPGPISDAIDRLEIVRRPS